MLYNDNNIPKAATADITDSKEDIPKNINTEDAKKMPVTTYKRMVLAP